MLGIATVLVSVGVIAFGAFAPGWLAHLLVSVLSFLLVWTALGVFNLVGYLHGTGVNKALWIRARRSQKD